MTIQQEFLDQIALEIGKLDANLEKEALSQWEEMYSKNTSITPKKARELAREYTILFLSQELQFRISKNISINK